MFPLRFHLTKFVSVFDTSGPGAASIVFEKNPARVKPYENQSFHPQKWFTDGVGAYS
jgi:hypothetical protein